MDSERINICVNSEIGKLRDVLVHLPGQEIENMGPENAHELLYSDILSKQAAQKEFRYFKKVLQKVARVHEVTDLLEFVLTDEKIKNNLVDNVCKAESAPYIADYLKGLDSKELARQLIEGVSVEGISYINNKRYVLPPLPNLYFMRDASVTMFDNIILCNMATKVRMREVMILEAIYKYHPLFMANTVNPVNMYSSNALGSIEGGDLLIVRDDIVLCGVGARTNTHGMQALVEHLKTKPGVKHLIMQELPLTPESFIHLDMVFTMLDVNYCMVYEPVILKDNDLKTFHITIDGQKAIGREETNLISALSGLGIDLNPICCGGQDNGYYPAREQWHSGCNFFCFEPGKFIGYARNQHTIEEINSYGFDVLTASDVATGQVNLNDYKKCVVTLDSNELVRGGGGARCMTMPLSRQIVDWGK